MFQMLAFVGMATPNSLTPSAKFNISEQSQALGHSPAMKPSQIETVKQSQAMKQSKSRAVEQSRASGAISSGGTLLRKGILSNLASSFRTLKLMSLGFLWRASAAIRLLSRLRLTFKECETTSKSIAVAATNNATASSTNGLVSGPLGHVPRPVSHHDHTSATALQKRKKKTVPVPNLTTAAVDEVVGWAKTLNLGHDLTLRAEHSEYMGWADQLYRRDMESLRAIEKRISEKMTDSFSYSARFHIAVKVAISKKLLDTMPPIHCTVVFAIWKEFRRMLPKGAERIPGVRDPNGENLVRRKQKQMSWLFENKKDSSWSILAVDDGCDGVDSSMKLDVGHQRKPSADLMEEIIEDSLFSRVTVHRLKNGILEGKTGEAGLDDKKLKSEDWNEHDKLVKASQKGGAILYGLSLACEDAKVHGVGKTHIIVYTDSDLSTDLAVSGLNFDTIINGKVDCSVSQRFGQPFAVNCSTSLPEAKGGGVGSGLSRDSIVHLTLRHKLRQNLLPPLAPIIDTNCGHKAILGEAAKDTVSMVKDYKGSFDMDWLMCVGICSKKADREPIGVTAIPWVASKAESKFWTPNKKGMDDPCAKVRPWFKIFAAITRISDSHSKKLQEVGLLTPESTAYVEWVKGLTVDDYKKLTDNILQKLGDEELTQMPDPIIMGMSLDDLKKCALNF